MKQMNKVTTKMKSFIGMDTDYIHLGKCPIGSFDIDLLARQSEQMVSNSAKKQSWDMFNIFGYGIQQMFSLVLNIFKTYALIIPLALAMMMINGLGHETLPFSVT